MWHGSEDREGEDLRVKLREVQELQETRTQRLHAVNSQLENQCTDLKRRMGVLSEDYAYNLALLEAREAEISRLDDAIAEVTSEMEAERTRAKAMSTKLHALEEDIQLKNLGAERDKAMNRKLVLELREEIEMLRVKTLEELSRKQHEIDLLKDEYRCLLAMKDQSLESQRRDLTQSFEKIIAQRDATSLEKDRQVSSKVSALEGTFEHIRAENMRLKAEFLEACRGRDSIAVELLQRDHMVCQLQLQLSDGALKNQQSEDALHRKLDTTERELATTKASALETLKHLNQAELEGEASRKAIADLEARLVLLAGHKEEVCFKLQKQLESSAGREAQLAQECRDLRDAVLRHTTMLATRDEECSQLRSEIFILETQVRDLHELSTEHNNNMQSALRDECSKYVDALDQQAAVSSRLQSEVSHLTSVLQNRDNELERRSLEIISELRVNSEERERLADSNASLARKLREEQREKESLQLRLEALSQRPPDSLRRDRFELASPVFSEDFGPISAPGSPLLSISKPPAREHRTALVDLEESSLDIVESREQALEDENAALKAIVKQMRDDIEQLTSQPRSPDTERMDLSRIPLLEKRLQVTVNEVARLRLERKKLMDVCNELHVALNEKHCKSEAVMKENAMAEDVDAEVPLSEGLHESILESASHPLFQHLDLFRIPIANSARATLSQKKALERIKRRDLHSKAVTSARRVVNYANQSSKDRPVHRDEGE